LLKSKIMELKKKLLHLSEKSKSAPVLLLNINKEKSKRRAWSSLPTVSLFSANQLTQKRVKFTNSSVTPVPIKLAMTTEKSIDIGFTAYANTLVHQHNHLRRPHMHEKDCDRLTSGFDKNREKRFYFTCQLTPVRVYVNYDRASSTMDCRLPNDKLDEFNCRQLDASCLKSNFGISQKFIKDASEFYFLKETLSFVPLLNEDQKLRHKKNRFQKIHKEVSPGKNRRKK
jgi:hypothetical protein